MALIVHSKPNVIHYLTSPVKPCITGLGSNHPYGICMKKPSMPVYTFRLLPALAAKLARAAKAQGVSRSDVLRDILTAALNK